MSTSTNANAKTASRQSDCPANSLYSRLPSVVANPAMAMRSARSKATRFTKEELAKLQRKNWCFYYKEVGDYWLQCSKEWQPMTAITNTALTLVNVNEVAMPQLGYVEIKNV